MEEYVDKLAALNIQNIVNGLVFVTVGSSLQYSHKAAAAASAASADSEEGAEKEREGKAVMTHMTEDSVVRSHEQLWQVLASNSQASDDLRGVVAAFLGATVTIDGV